MSDKPYLDWTFNGMKVQPYDSPLRFLVTSQTEGEPKTIWSSLTAIGVPEGVMSHDTFTPNELRDQLAWKGYILKWTPKTRTTTTCSSAAAVTAPPDRTWERSTGEIFDSIQEAKCYVVDGGK
jgi:hypothetical protein